MIYHRLIVEISRDIEFAWIIGRATVYGAERTISSTTDYDFRKWQLRFT